MNHFKLFSFLFFFVTILSANAQDDKKGLDIYDYAFIDFRDTDNIGWEFNSFVVKAYRISYVSQGSTGDDCSLVPTIALFDNFGGLTENRPHGIIYFHKEFSECFRPSYDDIRDVYYIHFVDNMMSSVIELLKNEKEVICYSKKKDNMYSWTGIYSNILTMTSK